MTDPKIVTLLPQLMGRVGAITKGQTNSHHGYSFRGIDDVMGAMQPHLIDLGISLTSEVISYEIHRGSNARGKAFTESVVHMRYTLSAEDASYVTTDAVGMAVDYDDKSMNQAQSQAFKMAMLQLLVSPTGTPDPDAHSPHSVEAAKPISDDEKLDRLTNAAKQSLSDAVGKDEAKTVWEELIGDTVITLQNIAEVQAAVAGFVIEANK